MKPSEEHEEPICSSLRSSWNPPPQQWDAHPHRTVKRMVAIKAILYLSASPLFFSMVSPSHVHSPDTIEGAGERSSGTQKTSPAMHKTVVWEEEKEKKKKKKKKKERKEKKRKQRSGMGKKGKKYWEMFSGSSCSSLGFVVLHGEEGFFLLGKKGHHFRWVFFF
jgi:hypothetical protein